MSDFNLEMSRVFNCDGKTLYMAIADGMLLKSCGCNTEKLEWDFRVGGKYRSSWDGECGDTSGEFLELREHDKIVFTWEYGSDRKTTVSISIKEEGGSSFLTLTHTGFISQEEVDDHNHGWTSGLGNLAKSW